MFPGGYRNRDVESVIRDLRDKRQYGRELMFVDNEFAALRPYTKKLLRRMIEEEFGFDIAVFARVEVAKDDELLSLMRQAGISYIYQGYESVQPETLKVYNKRQSLGQIIAAVEKLHAYGFRIWGSFVLGADTDTLETIRCTIHFVLEQKLSKAFFWPIWGHYPEPRKGYQTIIPWYRSIFRGWGYCDGHFVTHFPLHMRPSQLQRALIDCYRTTYSLTRVIQALKGHDFADAKGIALFMYQWRSIEKGTRAYMPFLEELEAGLYDPEGDLREDLLVQRVKKDPRWTIQVGSCTIEDFRSSPLKLPIPGKRNITCVPAELGPSQAI